MVPGHECSLRHQCRMYIEMGVERALNGKMRDCPSRHTPIRVSSRRPAVSKLPPIPTPESLPPLDPLTYALVENYRHLVLNHTRPNVQQLGLRGIPLDQSETGDATVE